MTKSTMSALDLLDFTWTSQMYIKRWSFIGVSIISAVEGQTLEANISDSVQILYSMYVFIWMVFWSAFQKCSWIFCQFCSFLIIGKIVRKMVKKYRFFDFFGPELIISNRIQGGVMSTTSPKGPSFQQKYNRLLRGTTARDIWFWILVCK